MRRTLLLGNQCMLRKSNRKMLIFFPALILFRSDLMCFKYMYTLRLCVFSTKNEIKMLTFRELATVSLGINISRGEPPRAKHRITPSKTLNMIAKYISVVLFFCHDVQEWPPRVTLLHIKNSWVTCFAPMALLFGLWFPESSSQRQMQYAPRLDDVLRQVQRDGRKTKPRYTLENVHRKCGRFTKKKTWIVDHNEFDDVITI